MVLKLHIPVLSWVPLNLSFVSPGCLCVISLHGRYLREGGLGGKMVDRRAHVLKSPIHQYDGRTGDYGRVRNVCVEVGGGGLTKSNESWV